MDRVTVLRQAVRRRWVAATAAAYAVALAAAAAGVAPLVLAGLLVFAIGAAGTTISVSNLADRRASVLDERQLASRDRAYRRAYRAIEWPLAALLVALLFALGSGQPSLPERLVPVAAVLLVGALLLVSFLPAAILAWTEPRTPDEGDGEEAIAAYRRAVLASEDGRGVATWARRNK
jgi:hypothetical protein